MNKKQLIKEMNHILEGGANDIRLMELFERYASQSPSIEGAGVWVKALEHEPTKPGVYHCKVKYFSKTELTPVGVEYDGSFWTLYDENKVIEWLDESKSPTQVTGDTVQFAEWINQKGWYCPLWANKSKLWILPKGDVESEEQTIEQLYSLYKQR